MFVGEYLCAEGEELAGREGLWFWICGWMEMGVRMAEMGWAQGGLRGGVGGVAVGFFLGLKSLLI